MAHKIKGSKILITGGTGSLGYGLAKLLYQDNRLVIYCRNEERQYEMKQHFKSDNIQFRIGDIRDQDTLEMALSGCDLAIHAAAMKDLIMCEEQPTQTYYNNIEGSKSFIAAVKSSKVKKAVAVSTDKAASPSSVYGASKYIMEKLFAEANTVSETIFSSVRFGNMIDSRGSLIAHWKRFPSDKIKLSHKEVARFFFTVREGAETVLEAMEKSKGGEIFIRKMKKARIEDVLSVITKRESFELCGLSPGEKVHEELVSPYETDFSFDEGDYYVIRPYQVNRNPPNMFSTENAMPFTRAELTDLIYSKMESY